MFLGEKSGARLPTLIFEAQMTWTLLKPENLSTVLNFDSKPGKCCWGSKSNAPGGLYFFQTVHSYYLSIINLELVRLFLFIA